LDGIKIRTAPLNQPNGATGYLVERGGKSVVCITDTEHVPGKPDQNIFCLIEATDLVIYDSTYAEDAFSKEIGWGHLTCNEGICLCWAAEAKQLTIFHHDPEYTDDVMGRIAIEPKALWDKSFVCSEGIDITFK
jgi:phosphoribosyl 1,2-cyclic phosphodiesterase